jgi:hypothetical protein
MMAPVARAVVATLGERHPPGKIPGVIGGVAFAAMCQYRLFIRLLLLCQQWLAVSQHGVDRMRAFRDGLPFGGCHHRRLVNQGELAPAIVLRFHCQP